MDSFVFFFSQTFSYCTWSTWGNTFPSCNVYFKGLLLYTLEFDMIPSHVTHPFALEFLSSYLMNTNNLEWMLMRYWFQLEWTYDSTTIFAPSFLILGITLWFSVICVQFKKGSAFYNFCCFLEITLPSNRKIGGH